MTETSAEVRSGRRLTPIWILPLVALAMGAWAVVYTLANEGPEVQVRFASAAGLTAGKTKVKFRELEVGVVKELRLSEDQQAVIGVLEMDRGIRDLLREDTRFWVVRARVSGANVSGLETLLSGAYIEFAPGDGKRGATKYVALDAPPQTPVGAPGLRLTLLSSRTHSVSAGDPVLYHGYTVGCVESLEFNLDDRNIRYQVFIDEPYHELVDSSVRFWDAGGITLKAGAEGFEFSTTSLETLLIGGVAFDRPPGFDRGLPAADGDQFRLYSSQAKSEQDPYRHGKYYVVEFTQSLRGLQSGAPVEYRGIQLGYVVKIMLEEMMAADIHGSGAPIPVMIYLEPGRLQAGDTPEMVETLHQSVAEGIGLGLRASLSTGNLLTGALYVNLEYYENLPSEEMGEYNGFPVIPATAGGFARIGQQVSELLDKVNGLALDETVDNANASLAQLSGTLEALRNILEQNDTQALTAELRNLLQELQALTAGMGPDSALYQSLDASLRELNETLSNLSALTGTLSAKPNAVVMPANIPDDPVPEAPR